MALTKNGELTLRTHIEVLERCWREHAAARRGTISTINSEGKLLMVATADVYEQAANALREALAKK